MNSRVDPDVICGPLSLTARRIGSRTATTQVQVTFCEALELKGLLDDIDKHAGHRRDLPLPWREQTLRPSRTLPRASWRSGALERTDGPGAGKSWFHGCTGRYPSGTYLFNQIQSDEPKTPD